MAVAPQATGLEASFDFHSGAAPTTVENRNLKELLTEQL